MRLVVFIAIWTLSAGQGLTESMHVFHFGIGGSSCASWLSNRASETEGKVWILGFWTGNNYDAASFHRNGRVGSTADAVGIIGEVKKRCTENPASSLLIEAGKVYDEFWKQGK